MTYKYSILQINYDLQDAINKMFEDYEHVINKFGVIDLGDYNEVANGEIVSVNVDTALEELFTIFNVRRPKDFNGHSLSVSDIVKIDDIYYYCDSIGWKKLSSEVIKEDYSVLTLDLLIEKLTSIRDFYKCGNHVVKFIGKNEEGHNITKNFTTDNFYDLPKSSMFMIDTLE